MPFKQKIEALNFRNAPCGNLARFRVLLSKNFGLFFLILLDGESKTFQNFWFLFDYSLQNAILTAKCPKN